MARYVEQLDKQIGLTRSKLFCSDKTCWGSIEGAYTTDNLLCLGCRARLVKKSPWEIINIRKASGHYRS